MSELPRARGESRDGVAGPPAGSAIRAEAALGALQRVLLTTDGSIVELLEVYFDEPIHAAGLVQVRTPASPADGELELSGHETILRRKVLLQGRRSRRNYVYAEASVVLDRLEPSVREGLLSTSETIGRLLDATPLETFREVLGVGRRRAGSLGGWFGMEEDDELLVRTYRVIAGGRPIMLATEFVPALYFAAERGSDGADVAASDGESAIDVTETTACC